MKSLRFKNSFKVGDHELGLLQAVGEHDPRDQKMAAWKVVVSDGMRVKAGCF